MDPEGKRLDMWMTSVGANCSELVELSWIADADSRELLDSFMSPDGIPLLVDFVEGESHA